MPPENKYPAAVEDVYGALHWVVENASLWGLDRHRRGVGGDSLGTNLAAAATLRRDRGGPPLSFQLLVYPVLDHDYQNKWLRRKGLAQCSLWGLVAAGLPQMRIQSAEGDLDFECR